MQKKYLIAGLPAVLALAASAQAANIWTWTGTDSANWNDSANWLNASSATGVPTTGDSVVLTGQGTYQPTDQNITALSVATVSMDGTLPTGFTLSGSPLTISSTNGSSTTGLTLLGSALTATMAAGANSTITLAPADAAKIAVGDAVTMTNGIQAGTTVQSVNLSTGIVTLSQPTTTAAKAQAQVLNFAAATTWNADMNMGGIFNGPANTTLGGNITLTANSSWNSYTSYGVLTVNGNVNIGNYNLYLFGGQAFNGCGSMLTINGNITGSGTLTMSSSGSKMVELNGDNSGFTGVIDLTRSALGINSDAALGAVPTTLTTEIVAGASQLPELDFSGTGFTVNANRGITVNTPGLVFNAATGQTYTIAGTISDGISGTTGRVGNGANNSLTGAYEGGTIILAGQNTFSGGLVLSAESEIGVTSDGGFGAVPSSFQANNIFFNSAYTQQAKLYFPDSMTINANRGIVMGGTGQTKASNATVSLSVFDVNDGATVGYAGVLADNAVGQNGVWTNNFQKIGAGTFILSTLGMGTYNGDTFIGGGTLLINGTLDNTGLTVYTSNAASGTTFGILGGNGTINRPVTIARNSASGLAPGAGGIGSVGTLTVGNFTVNGGTTGTTGTAPTWYVDLSGSSSDELAINGNFTFATGATNFLDIDLNSVGPLVVGQYTLATWSGTSPAAAISQYILDYGNTGLTAGTAGLAYGDSSLVLNVTGVPEPASLGLLALSATGLLMRRRRRRESLN